MGINGSAGVSGFGHRKKGPLNLRELSLVKATAESVSAIALSPVLEVLWRRRSAAAPRGALGLDGTRKISKDMAMTGMPRIDARLSCAERGFRGG